MIRRAYVLAVLLVSPPVVAAQFPADVATGARVQVWLPEAWRQENGPGHRLIVRGNVAGVTGDSIRLSIPGTTGTITVPRNDIRRMYLSRGEPSRVASALERGVGAAIVGALVWGLTNDPDRSDPPNYSSDWRAAGVGAAWAGGVGAAVGLIWPHERWRRVRLRN